MKAGKRWAAWAGLALLTGCAPAAAPTPAALKPLGLVEISFDGLGSTQASSQVRPLALKENSGGLDLSPLSVSVTDVGVRGSGGTRYITATYRVRNAAADGTPSAQARSNITLLAAGVADNVDGTALRSMTTFSGAPVPTSVARTVLPTHAVEYAPATERVVTVAGGAHLQVLTEAEVVPGNLTQGGVPAASYAALGVTTVFPYGYVTHTRTGGRTLGANPAAGQYDGRVALSVRVPLQANDNAQTPTQGSQRDPWAFKMTFLVVEDPATRITQSLEEQSFSDTNILARGVETGATEVNLLPGSAYASGATLPSRRVCQVRTAGLAGAGTASYLVNSCP
ncbi:hypothetical protein GO986_06375 [Deinococcus sp. HMF7620]|uniref:Lipoprotein n=1 Tax=Deinococcus arboris TaxID=2682977 RepID=A0A7C9HXP1_9DEIO|nr:hypothetical protein [Deinococcus arboris]MVN86388.1 hypothetical protein [Deinococcus arboris]